MKSIKIRIAYFSIACGVWIYPLQIRPKVLEETGFGSLIDDKNRFFLCVVILCGKSLSVSAEMNTLPDSPQNVLR